jgi:signal peptidase I
MRAGPGAGDRRSGRTTPRPVARHANRRGRTPTGDIEHGVEPVVEPVPVQPGFGALPLGAPQSIGAPQPLGAPQPFGAPQPLGAPQPFGVPEVAVPEVAAVGGRAVARRRAGTGPAPTHVQPTPSAGQHRSPAGSRSRAASTLSGVGEVVVVVGLALVLALVVKTFLVQAFYIPSESMERTLLVGDRVLVSKLTPGPFALHRGDVVVFKDPGGWLDPPPPPQDGAVRHVVRVALTFVGLLPQDSGEHLIKRVIGLPGDQVACCDAQGKVTVNGTAVEESYLQPGIEPSSLKFNVTVPAGRLWVLGDNRPSSEDSRYHVTLAGGGTVPVSDVVGRAFVVVWPLGRAGGLGAPDDVFADVPPGGSRP